MFPTIPLPPALTASQMREVDRVMVEDIGISLPQMMENAGRSLALLARERYSPRSITVLAGDLYLADISVPAAVYRDLGIELHDPFGSGPVVRIV